MEGRSSRLSRRESKRSFASELVLDEKLKERSEKVLVALIIKEPITTLHLTLLLHSVIVPVSFSSILLLHLWTATIGQIIERMESCMLMSF